MINEKGFIKQDVEDLIIHLNLQGIDANLNYADIDLIIDALEYYKDNNYIG